MIHFSPNAVWQARQKARITQRQLANLLGVRPLTVSRWETGKCVPRGGSLHRVEAWLNGTSHRMTQAQVLTVEAESHLDAAKKKLSEALRLVAGEGERAAESPAPKVRSAPNVGSGTEFRI